MDSVTGVGVSVPVSPYRPDLYFPQRAEAPDRAGSGRIGARDQAGGFRINRKQGVVGLLTADQEGEIQKDQQKTGSSWTVDRRPGRRDPEGPSCL